MDLLILTAQQHQELLLFTQQVDGDFERSVLIKQEPGMDTMVLNWWTGTR